MAAQTFNTSILSPAVEYRLNGKAFTQKRYPMF